VASQLTNTNKVVSEMDWKRYLIQGSGGTFGIIVLNTGLAFLVNLILARTLGAKNFGFYAYAMSWVGLLSIPALFGMDQILIRNIAAYQAKEKWQLMCGLVTFAHRVSMAVSVIFAFLAALFASVVTGFSKTQLLSTFGIALSLLPLLTLIRIKQATMQGLHHVVSGQAPAMLGQPAFLIVLIALGITLGIKLSTGIAILLYGISALISLSLLSWLLYKSFPVKARSAIPAYNRRLWIKTALPLMMLGGLQVVNAQSGVAILGAMKNVEEAGIYAVANRAASVMGFALLSVNAVLAPSIATLYANREMKKLQSIVTKSVRVVSIFSTAGLVTIVFFGSWLLSLFGPEFPRGYTALLILCGGQMINSMMGSVGQLLIMTGNEQDAAISAGAGVLVVISLNFILIPYLGMIGAAYAATASILTWNILMAIQVRKHLKIYATVFGGWNICRNL